MRKRAFVLILTCALILSCANVVSATDPRSREHYPSLSFNGLIARCSISITEFGSEIVIIMELWEGNSLFRSWTASGTDLLSITKECTVNDCVTYTLKVYGTIGGTAFQCAPVSGCV